MEEINKIRQYYREIAEESEIWAVEKDFVELSKVNGPKLPNWIQGETLYQIYLRAFTEEGTFTAAKEKLPYLYDLGIRFLWLMPIYPVGQIDKKGNKGSPYAVSDYFTVNPDFGTNQDFQDFMQAAHKMGMRVILDMVVNHVAPDYNQPQYFLRDENSQPARKVEDWSDVVDLDYNNPETRKHVLDILKFWVEKYNIDGYRCDVAGLVPLDFWEDAIPKVNKIKENLFWLAEWESPYLSKKAFHSYYDWTLYTVMKSVNKGKRTADDLMQWIQIKQEMYPQNCLPMRFLENHDLQRAATVFGKEAILPFLTFMFSIPGLPLIYNGQEFLETAFSSLFEKEPYRWPKTPGHHFEKIKELISLRRNYPALASAKLEQIKTNDSKYVLVLIKENKLYIYINFSEKATRAEFEQIDKMEVLFNTHSKLNLSENNLQLEPYQAVIFDKRES